MGQTADQLLTLIGIRRRERDRREAAVREAHGAFEAAQDAVDEARRAVDAARRASAAAQRARCEAPCDMLIADHCRAEHDRLEGCQTQVAACAQELEAAQQTLAAARLERQRAQVRLDVLESEHSSAQARERRRGERKREDALPAFGAFAAPC